MPKILEKKIVRVGVTGYAKHRGISKSAVSQIIKAGKIEEAVHFTKNGNGKRAHIDLELADKLWNIRVAKTVQSAHSNSDDKHPAHGITKEDNEAAPGQGPSYANARSIKETYSAKMAQIAYEEKSGSLCKTEDVARAAKDMSRITRDYLLTLPDKLSPILAAENDVDEIFKLLSDEVHHALDSLSKGKIF